MFSNIMVPVDLAHSDKLEKAVAVAADMAKHYGAKVTLVGVTGTAPGSVAHNPAEFGEKLDAYGKKMSDRHVVDFSTLAKTSPDPAADLDKALELAAGETGADLVIMQSHVPGMLDRLFSSNAGYFTAHSDLSVFVVRG